MATRKAAVLPPAPPPPVAPVFGNYRCTWPNEWGRQCNKFMGQGTGAFARNCPRCKRPCRFENPNEMIP